MTTVKFPLTLEAVQKGDRVQWAVGDALLKEINELEEDSAEIARELQRCSEGLSEKGFDKYTTIYLRQLRATAKNFPRAKRDDEIPWNVYLHAGTLENLEQLVIVLRKLKKPITGENAVMVMAEWRRKEREEREAAAADAQKEIDRATAAKKKARDEEVRAKDAAEKEAARKAKEKAKDEEEKARQRKAQASSPPKGRTMTTKPPEQSELRVMAAANEILANARKIRQLLRGSVESIDVILDRLDPETRTSLVEAHQDIETLASQIIKRFGSKRDRFRTIEGGAA